MLLDPHHSYKKREILKKIQALLGKHYKVAWNVSILFIISILYAPLLSAQTVIHASSSSSEEDSSSSSISIEIEPSRSVMAVGSGMGIAAKITNNSNKTIYLRENNLTMTLPLELEVPGTQAENGYFAYFPANHTAPTDNDARDPWSNWIVVQPEGSYRAIWSFSEQSPNRSDINSTGLGKSPSDPVSLSDIVTQLRNEIRYQLYYIFFQPGDYQIVVNATYWTTLPSPSDNNIDFKALPTSNTNKYTVYTKTKMIPVQAPEFVILLGAAIGGLLSSLIELTKERNRRSDNAVSGWKSWMLNYILHPLVLIMRSMLLSGIVTVLLSRLSDSKFLINVTVNDFWGAIATGFIASYVGGTWLDKVLDKQDAKHAEPETNASRESHRTDNGQSPQPGAESSDGLESPDHKKSLEASDLEGV